MKKITKIVAALLTLVLLVAGVTSCGNTTALEQELAALKETVSGLSAENEQLKQQAIAAKEELANQKAALESLKKESEEAIAKLEATLNGQFQIKVIDIDGEVLADDFVYCRDATSVTELLRNSYDMVDYTSAYGTTIVSVLHSVVDPNYYVSITENGMYAEVGVDGLVIDPGDVFEFRVECWNTVSSGYGTMDEYDLLVDKAIYSYMKSILPETAKQATTYTDSLYWDQAAVTFMAANGYDTGLFRLSYSDAYTTALEAVDVTALTGTQFMKYYYAQKSLGREVSQDFKNTFSAAVSSSCADWLLPVAKALAVKTQGVTDSVATAPSESMTWGPDMSIWSYVLKGLYRDYDGYLARYTDRLDWENGTSTALVLLAFAKDGINPRQETYEKDGKDIIEVLFDTYYDATLNLVKVNATDTGTNFSTNQIYASLMAYKACRDLGTKVNIFA